MLSTSTLLCSHRAPCPSTAQRPPAPRLAPALPAGRRGAPSGGSRSRSRQAPGPKPPTPHPDPSQPPSADENAEPPEVPSVGWMWQPSSDRSGGAASRPMPSAMATVVNLYENRIKAKKSLGQNFLTDDSILRDIVAAAGVGPGDLVLEVGPGTGNLTKHLLATGARVTAVEKDDTLYGRLTEEYKEVPELRLVHGDALKVGLEDVLRGMLTQERQAPEAAAEAETAEAPTAASGGDSDSGSSSLPSTSAKAEPPAAVAGVGRRARGGAAAGRSVASSSSPGGGGRGKIKVVANLPYNITRDVLTQLLPLGELIAELHVMIQHEAAERLTEKTPGGPEWRAANIRTLFYSKPRYRFRISRHKYDPVPGVDGALVTFALLPPGSRPRVPSERSFHSLVAKAFSERRKKMRNSVQPLYSPEQVERALLGCGLSADARAQDLTLQQWVALAWALQAQAAEQAAELLGRAGGEAAEAEEAEEEAAGEAQAGAGQVAEAAVGER
ncbi:hypothetical protein GPECTOR_4g615 [Gonium pectorale]|uniref:rRNA adenine N(6)-methyltransferase n=1 Tax=Gonium pectorale TaxID=33097 RepID=A0A150GYY9_GONPE|nr:hypothetical protein GPECTOR_4g615 [Gonium pectorale]|eukprot:KXZ54550.1 hypothetical protein GPECTOR_4g615 [Gonium pectorale]